MSKKKQSKRYDAEFKQSAVELALTNDQPIADTARDLGIVPNTLYGWIAKSDSAEKAVAGPGGEVRIYDELRRLQKENRRLKEEREILKKAAAYFAKAAE